MGSPPPTLTTAATTNQSHERSNVLSEEMSFINIFICLSHMAILLNGEQREQSKRTVLDGHGLPGAYLIQHKGFQIKSAQWNI